MCLLPEWFEKRAERRAERDRYGVSLREAEADLRTWKSTIDPVAVEMAEWILANWSERKINTLDWEVRDIFREIVAELKLRPRDVASSSDTW